VSHSQSESSPHHTSRNPRHAIVAALLLSALLPMACDRAVPPTDSTSEESQELGKAYNASESTESVATTPLPFPSNDWTCDLAHAERAQAWVDATRPAPADQRLASIPELSPAEATPRLLIGVSDSTLSLMQRDFGDDFNAAASAIEEARENAAGQPSLFAVALRIDGATSAERMSAILSALRSELGEEVLFVVPASPPTERAEPPVATALKRAEQAASPGALQSCAPVDALMDNLEALPPARRSSSLREGLVDAWIQCDCEADLEAFLAAKIWPMA